MSVAWAYCVSQLLVFQWTEKEREREGERATVTRLAC